MTEPGNESVSASVSVSTQPNTIILADGSMFLTPGHRINYDYQSELTGELSPIRKRFLDAMEQVLLNLVKSKFEPLQ